MLAPRLHRVFWNIYGRFAWDGVQSPTRKRIVREVVLTLKERSEVNGETVLDAGCGTGNYAVALAQEGFRVTGIDYSSGMLAAARSKITGELSGRLSFDKMDMNSRLSLPDSGYDHVICMTSLWAVTKPRFTLGELCRVLKPGGTLMIMQIPRPSVGLRQIVKTRVAHMERKSILAVVLVVVKAVLERTSANRYWTPEELLSLVLGSRQLKVNFVDHGPPILIAASKITNS